MNQAMVGKFLQSLRNEKGLTQKQLAEKIGVSDRAVSKWENGRGLPDYDNVQALCMEFGISFNELISAEKISTCNIETKLEENLINIYKEERRIQKKIQVIKQIFCIIIMGILAYFLATSIADLKIKNVSVSERENAFFAEIEYSAELAITIEGEKNNLYKEFINNKKALRLFRRTFRPELKKTAIENLFFPINSKNYMRYACASNELNTIICRFFDIYENRDKNLRIKYICDNYCGTEYEKRELAVLLPYDDSFAIKYRSLIQGR